MVCAEKSKSSNGLVYVVHATTINGRKTVVAESVEKVNLRHLKELLVMRSQDFDETTRLVQYRVALEEAKH